MPPDAKQILAFIRNDAGHPMKIKELAQAMGVSRPTYAEFRDLVKNLIEAGDLVRLKRNRVGLPDEMNVVVGIIRLTRSGSGYLLRSDQEDLLISATHTRNALDGDKVMARLTGYHFDREAGQVIRIVERSERAIIGVFKRGRDFNFIVPDSPRMERDFYVAEHDSLEAVDGEKVVARLVEWEDPYLNPQAKIIERLGFPGDPGVDLMTVIRSRDLPLEFPPRVLAEAENLASLPDSDEISRREDLTGECTYTIDPADAKDHDDAVSVTKISGGYRLGVHIADVSFFVPPGGAVDEEAFRRGNSVYLPGMVIPMLPEVLSNDMCSLRPNRRRLAHSVIMDFDTEGKMLSWRVADTVIKSQAKLAYEEVQALFDDVPAVPDRVARVRNSLMIARELARLIGKRRFEQGSLDFDLPESKVILNARGEVLELANRVRLEAHRLVEEFMLAANRAVAMEVFRKGQALLYRVHERPNMEKLNEFSAMMGRLGLSFPVTEDLAPVHFARFLNEIQDRPEADFINELMLRSMMKAVYQRKNIGHFGLAFKHYTHFTSPIRRYPDLLVHRLLRQLQNRSSYPPAFAKRVLSVIDHVGEHCSETERVAEAAEREAVKIKQVSYMANHVGDEYGGVISGVTNYGFFVRLDGIGAEGMVRISSIDDDFYHFDEANFRLVGRRTGRSFRMGDAVKVGVMTVDQARNEVTLFLVPEKASGRRRTAKPPSPKPSAKKKSPPPKQKAKKKSPPPKRYTKNKAGKKRR
ncbi:MAG: ribonuclease R [bacterium]